MGKKSGKLVSHYPPWLRLFSQLFKQSPAESPKHSESNKLHAPEPLIALDQLRVLSEVTVFQRNGSIPDMTSQTDLHRITLCKQAFKVDCDLESAIDPLPFWLGREQKMLGFSQVLKPIKWQDLLE